MSTAILQFSAEISNERYAIVMPKAGWTPTFRMKQLPKPEYQLLKDMIAQYNLEDPSELITALLRLAAEVDSLHNATITDGSAWLQRLITETVTDVRS